MGQSLYSIGSDPRLKHEFETRHGVRADECAALLTDCSATRRDSIAPNQATNRSTVKLVQVFSADLIANSGERSWPKLIPKRPVTLTTMS